MLVRFGNSWNLEDGEEQCSTFAELHLGAHVPLEFNSPLPSEDIWKKFDLPDVPMTDFWSSEDYDEFDNLVEQYTSAAAVSSSFWANLDPPCKDAREIRHHDCMWAGHCINKEHDRTLQQIKKKTPPCDVKQEVSNVRTEPSSPSKTARTAKPNNSASLLVNSSVVKSNNSRSLLLTSRTNTTRDEKPQIANHYQRPSLESDGDSPRPDTPQSLSESEDENDDIPRFRHSLGVVIRSSVAVVDSNIPADFFSVPIKQEPKVEVKEEVDEEDSTLAVSVSEVTGQVCRAVVKQEEKEEPVIKTETPDAFYSDHSYHLSKGSVKMENLGVQTPSDSEEEIDVVSVGDKQGGGRLPNNPSARDRQQLQLTVASAIRQHQQPNTIPMRITIGDRTVSVRTIPTDSLVDPDRKRKYSSGRGSSGKSNKRTKYQYHHRMQHHKTSSRRSGSRGTSDSEPDSCEKRSLHNDMERQRRIDLRNLVEGLRVLVPEVADKKRAAKVVILKEAASYCHRLYEQDKTLHLRTTELQRQQEHLRARLSQLRRQMAARR